MTQKRILHYIFRRVVISPFKEWRALLNVINVYVLCGLLLAQPDGLKLPRTQVSFRDVKCGGADILKTHLITGATDLAAAHLIPVNFARDFYAVLKTRLVPHHKRIVCPQARRADCQYLRNV